MQLWLHLEREYSPTENKGSEHSCHLFLDETTSSVAWPDELLWHKKQGEADR